MSNVLGELFQNIANAIRGKTGETGTMKPSEFPENINSIVTGGEEKQLRYADGEFDVTSDIMTINHDMGVVPDIIMVLPYHIPTERTLIFSTGLSTPMISALGNKYIAPSCGITQAGYVVIRSSKGHETDGEYPMYGLVRNVTTESFTVGSTLVPLSREGQGYLWLAIAGIV